MGHHKDHCKKLKCEEKHIIKCLPYHISCPGHYCLGRDFEWDQSEVVAITIKADNVVLDFNQRKIKASAAGVDPFLPVLLVEESSDVVLNNVDIEGVGAGKYSRGGLVINQSSKVTVNSAILKNLGVGQNSSGETFTALSSNDLTISNLIETNDNDVVEGGGVIGFIVYGCSNVMFKDSKLRNTRALINNVQNVLISRVQIDNSDASGIRGFQIQTDGSFTFGGKKTDGVRVNECEVRTLNALGIFVASFPILPKPDQLTRNVLIENTTVQTVGDDSILLQIVDDCQVKNCLCHVDNGEGTFTAGIFILIGNRNIIENNTIECTNGADVGIGFEDYLGGNPVNTEANVIRGNLISRDDSPLSGNLSAPLGSYGIIGLGAGFGRYNTVDRNVVSCFTFGYSDASLIDEPFPASCTIFSNNVANGNVVNFDVTEDAPINSLLVNNIKGCNKPAPEPVEEATVSATEGTKKKERFPTKLAEKN